MIAIHKTHIHKTQIVRQRQSQTTTHSNELHCENELVKQHTGLIVNIAKRFNPPNLTVLDEYIQNGRIGLLKAIRKYDPVFKVYFSTFAWKCIKNEIAYYIAKEKRHTERFFNSNYISEDKTEKEQIYEYFFDEMSAIEKNIMIMRSQGFTYKEIGYYTGKSQGQILRIYHKLIPKIKKNNV